MSLYHVTVSDVLVRGNLPNTQTHEKKKKKEKGTATKKLGCYRSEENNNGKEGREGVGRGGSGGQPG